ncbi:MAG: MFS transporter [Anaerolineales bacterium]|nr:MFS transporter [Anaerolineales bacterium]
MQQNQVMQKQEPKSAKGNGRLSPLSLLRLRDFRLLWLGQAISLIGDQFYLIALPWLTLQLTGDALAVGTVLAIAGIPRALFMLIGGAFTDRFSPRLIMMGTNLFRMVLVAVLAVMVWSGFIQLWHLYLFALFFGLADAFFYPAQSAIVPQILERDALQTGNAIVQGTAQFSLFLGPVLAGATIALFAKSGSGTDAVNYSGLAAAFAIDAATFLVSTVSLWLIHCGLAETAVSTPKKPENVLPAIRAAIAYVGRDTILRAFTIINAAISIVMSGAIAVGIPILANVRFSEGATAFGLIMSALGAGSLLGMVIAGSLPRPRVGLFGPVLLWVTAVSGFGLILFPFLPTVWAAAATIFVMGIASGYVTILLITWLQMRIPPAMLGRMMSLIMFTSIGLAPVANALAGAILKMSLTGLFVGSGGLLLFVILVSLINPAVRAMPPNPSPQEGV